MAKPFIFEMNSLHRAKTTQNTEINHFLSELIILLPTQQQEQHNTQIIQVWNELIDWTTTTKYQSHLFLKWINYTGRQINNRTPFPPHFLYFFQLFISKMH